jgi:hypothetical protein
MADETFLSDIWSLYFHDPNDNDWTTNSYHFIYNINTVETFCIIFHHFKDYWNKGMFFIMREGITPRWEDESNINGGCFSIKVFPNDLEDYWFELASTLLGDTLAINEEHSFNINGISISPKNKYFIIRIWCKDDSITKREFYNISSKRSNTILYKKHSDNV